MSSRDELSAVLVELGVPTLHEANSRKGLMQDVRLVVGDAFAGPAETVAVPAGDNLGLHVALERAEPGAVICVASGGRGVYALMGELMSEAARARSVAALVLDDGLRDVERLIAPPAIAARGVVSRGTVKLRVAAMGEPVAVGRVLVRPGDWVVGDLNGVCVLAGDEVEAIVDRARQRAEKEDGIRRVLRSGASTVEALGLARPSAASSDSGSRP
jgi:4-hydroxy-4-methyl-2-oxoglutarate aldolase